MSTEYHDLKAIAEEIHTCNGGEDCARCDAEEAKNLKDEDAAETTLEGALERILFTPGKVTKMTHNAYCDGACGKKIRLPVGETKKCPDCPGTIR
jgi:hypothetical protein